MISKRHACLATLLYADIFDFPLTAREAIYWSVFYENPCPFPKEIKKKKQFFIFPGREAIVATREKRRRRARKKWRIAGRVARILRCIPTIKLIGVTGGLAMDNAREEDDIDLFFIVAPGTLWISRLLAILAIELLGKRRRRGTTNVKNLICLNMFLSVSSLAIPVEDQDLYTAHEVLQMQPLVNHGNTYQQFLESNRWVKHFLPNAWKQKIASVIPADAGIHHHGSPIRACPVLDTGSGTTRDIIISILRFFEPIAKYLQLRYMKNHRTTEVVSDTVLRFHPNDARVWVKKALDDRLKSYNIPLDKVFYAR